MGNLAREVPAAGCKISAVLTHLDMALDLDNDEPLRCVGVMIQYGKTLTNPKDYQKTVGGGHVSVFVVNSSGLQTWDEITDTSWQKGVINSAPFEEGTPFLRPSSKNDVSIYVHPATNQQITSVVTRANHYVDDFGDEDDKPSLNYNHYPSVGKPVNNGDCVTRSSWVMSAFSYSPRIRGFLTPWGVASAYEIYTLPGNVMSKWVKVKYKGAKLPVM